MATEKGFRIQVSTEWKTIDVLTDTLIAKKKTEKNHEYEVIALSLYGTKSDLKNILKKNSSTNFRIKQNGYRQNKYHIDKAANYEIEEVKGKYTTRATIVKRKNLLLDQTKQVTPIIIIPGSESHTLRETVFEYVRDSIVAPLFPDLTNPSKLSKELFISREEATQVLENVRLQNFVSENEEIAADGIQKYKEWVNYLYDRLQADNKIKSLEVVAFQEDVLAYEVVVDEKEIRNYITEGIQNDIITISNNKNHWNHYARFDQYMGRYAKILKKVIESQAEPLHRKGDIRQKTIDVLNTLGREPLGAQTDAIEAMVKSIQHQKKVNIVGEPGVGKTLMMSSAAYLDAVYSNKPLKGLVLSPGHLIKTAWEEEVKTTLLDVDYHHIRSVKDLIKYENKGFLDDDKHRIFILGQNAAKSGYTNKPEVIWNKEKKHFCCPDCNKVVTKRVFNEKSRMNYNESKYIDVPVPFDHFATERFNNRKCKHCGTVLWGANNKQSAGSFKAYITQEEQEPKFLYSTLGFVPRDEKVIEMALEKAVEVHNEKRTKVTKGRIEHLRKIQMMLEGTMKEVNPISTYKVPISYYIKKKLKNRFSHLIIDEYHEFQSNGTVRTASAAQLIASVSKIITGTGTMMNGYAKSRFFNDFMLFPEKMKKAGFEVGDVEKYQVAFGVTEKRFRLKTDGKRQALAPKAKPGISPIIFPLFLQDSTVFISMADLENDMPDLKHEIVEVEMATELNDGKVKLENSVREVARGDKKLFKGLMPTLYSYLDMPTVEREVKDADDNVYYTTEKLDAHIDKKMEALKRIVRKEKMSGRRSIVYTHYTSDGINNYIQEKLQEDGFNVTVLNKEGDSSVSCDGSEIRVKKDEREVFVKEEVAKGTDILVVNPTLVQTGTNLIDFASIIYYQMGYQVYTIRQADRRTWRIGQEEDCSIYYLYYKDSFQADIASLMATKIVASEAIEGNMDAKGLEAITNDRTPEEELAKKFFEHMDL